MCHAVLGDDSMSRSVDVNTEYSIQQCRSSLLYISVQASVPKMALAKPKAFLPNWALATILAGFVGGTYWYSMRAVGSDDLEKELARENARQQKKLQESA